MARIQIKATRHPVLFVDDDELVLKQMIRLFHRNTNIELLTAGSVVKARDIMASKEIHMLVTDQRMPKYDGTTLLAYARRHQPNALRILLTGHADTKVLADSINKGNLFRYYSKPVVPETFVSELTSLLQVYEERMEQQGRRILMGNTTKTVQTTNSQLRLPLNKNVFHYNDMQSMLRALDAIGRTLSEESDGDQLLRLILGTCRNITNADAGTIYLIEEDASGQRLQMKYAFNYSRDIPYEEKPMPIDASSIAGFVALNQEPVLISDAYSIPVDKPYTFNRSFDSLFDYRTRSMVVIPIRSVRGSTLGVIQLINRKAGVFAIEGEEPVLDTQDDFAEMVIPFSQGQIEFLEAVAGQAAIAIENVDLVRQLNSRFEGFAVASIKAVEARDPTTSGHSLRVASLSVAIARRIGTLQPDEIKALEYAAILHDIGKIYIDPAILTKDRKLDPSDYSRIQHTLDYMYRYQELSYSRHELRLHDLAARTKINQALVIRELHDERDRVLQRIRGIKLSVEILNEPGRDHPSDQEVLDRLVKELNSMKCLDIDDVQLHPFNVGDIASLAIKNGTLTDVERSELEKHVVYTKRIISEIPWPKHLKSVPMICQLHHEKLDGTGYPDGISADAIPVSARILMVADMFDALTVRDREYGETTSANGALAILSREAKAGRIDPDVTDALRLILEDQASLSSAPSMKRELLQ